MQKQNMEKFFKDFLLVWLVQFLKTLPDKSKFSWLALLFKLFFIKIQPNMNDWEKNWQRIYDLLNAKTIQKKIPEMVGVSLSTFYKAKKKILQKRVFWGKSRGLNKKQNEGFLTAFATVIKSGTIMLIRKHTNELKVYEKTVRRAIK